MPFAELPDGSLINTDHVVRTKPLTSGATRVWYTGGATEDIIEEYAEILRKEMKPPTPKKRAGTKST